MAKTKARKDADPTDEQAEARTRAEADRALGKRAVRDRVSALAHLHHPSKGLQVGLEHMGIYKGPVADEQVEYADSIRWDMIGQLSHCETFIGDTQVCQLLNASAAGYPTAHVFLTDVLAPTGLVYFADPIADPDTQLAADGLRPPEADVDCPIRAMSWALMALPDPDQVQDPEFEEGVFVYDAYERERWERTMIRAKGRFKLVITAYTDMRNIPNPGRVPGSKLPTIYPTSSVRWDIDTDDGGMEWHDEGYAELAERGRAPYVKILMAFWAIMRQRLTVTTDTVVRPHPREITYHKGRTVDFNADVHVVRLQARKSRYVYTEHTGHSYNRPDWSVQWWVRPHWRKQTDRRTGEVKPALLIAAHRKGPEDKPMVGQDRIYLPPTDAPQPPVHGPGCQCGQDVHASPNVW